MDWTTFSLKSQKSETIDTVSCSKIDTKLVYIWSNMDELTQAKKKITVVTTRVTDIQTVWSMRHVKLPKYHFSENNCHFVNLFLI